MNQYVNQDIYEIYDTRAVLLNIDSFWLCANISTTCRVYVCLVHGFSKRHTRQSLKEMAEQAVYFYSTPASIQNVIRLIPPAGCPYIMHDVKTPTQGGAHRAPSFVVYVQKRTKKAKTKTDLFVNRTDIANGCLKKRELKRRLP